MVRFFIAFLNGDVEDMKRSAALARGKPSSEDMISHVEALALARSGRLQEAARISAVAVDAAQRSGRRERAALFDAATAVWEAFYGNAAAARQKVTRALDLARGRDVDYAAAFALVLSGDVARSRALADEIRCAGAAALHVSNKVYALEDFAPAAHVPDSWSDAWVEALVAAQIQHVTTIENEFPFLSYIQ